MSDKGTIIAIDNSLPRVRMMKQTLDRLDLRSVKSVVGDVLSVPTLFRAPLDKILLDVPCSGTGVLGRHPEGKWRKDRAGIDVLKAVQLQMLNSLGTILQKGGELLYTTCSLLVEENENVIDGFIEDSSYSLVDLRSRGNSLPADVFTKRGELKVLPHIHGCDGFYAALLEKR
jgi:16S rRNA (cytosine967-C5)-methyltransferase